MNSLGCFRGNFPVLADAAAFGIFDTKGEILTFANKQVARVGTANFNFREITVLLLLKKC